MKNTLFMLVIGLVFGSGIGFLLSQATGLQMTEHDHASHGVPHDDHGAMASGSQTGSQTGGHDHDTLLPVEAPLPQVMLHATPEGGGALNLHIMTENFRFAPHRVNSCHVRGEGHAHVYVDGTKVMRAYGPWVHLTGIRPGEVEIRVTLNANSHEQMADGESPIEAVETVTVE